MQNDLTGLFEEFIVECSFTTRLRSETIKGYKAVFKLFLKIMPEVSNFESLTPGILCEFFKRIGTRERPVGKTIKTGVKSSTIKTQWTKLNVFFDWLERNGYLDHNPLKDIRPPRVSYDDYQRLENAEIAKIYSAITICPDLMLARRRDTMMVSLLLCCGLRKGELISLQVRDIDLQKNIITIRGETSKSKRTRTLPIHQTLAMHIKDYFRERKLCGLKTEYMIVSTKEDRQLTLHGLKHWVKSLIKKSGVKFHLHQFRHTFACKLTEGGTPTASLQKLMGHTNISMTAKYTRSLQSENMSEDINKISF